MSLLNIIINEVEVPEIEYKQERVLPLKLIDEIHGRPEATARKRFNDNKQYFIENEDYFTISASEFRTQKWGYFGFGRQSQNGILITKTGYLLLVKSFTDDLAWEVQRKLIEGYFIDKPDYLKLKFSDFSSNLKEIRAITQLLPGVTDALLLKTLWHELEQRHSFAGLPTPDFTLLGKNYKQTALPGFDMELLEEKSA